MELGGGISSIGEVAEKARDIVDCVSAQVKGSMNSMLTALGFSSDEISLVMGAVDANAVDPNSIAPSLQNMVNGIPNQVSGLAQSEVNREAAENSPQKPGSSVNGLQSDPVIEPINVYKVSSPKDIPNNNNSYEEDHPNVFGNKDRAGNFYKHNLLTGLHQQGLRNGYLFRSDQNGNTTIYIPGNHKFRIDQTLNINAGATDFFMAGQGHFESSSKITIKAPEVEIIGHLTVTGPQDNTQTIVAKGDITSEASIFGKVEGVFGGISSTQHVHPQTAGDDRGGGTNTYKPTGGSFKTKYAPSRVDRGESYYVSNIKPAIPNNVPAGHPDNPEQVETTAATMSGVEGTQRNPFEEALALMNLGSSAWKETGSNKNIANLWDEIGYNGAQYADQTAWCAVFVSSVLKRTGNKYLKTASSKSYANYGQEVTLANAKVGDLVVFSRNGSSSGYGHVGFYAGTKTSTTIAILGGNQSNSLNIRNFKISDPATGWSIASIRRAVDAETGSNTPPDYTYAYNGSSSGGSVT